MKALLLSAVLSASLPLIEAHTRFTTLYVNKKSQGDGTCLRMDMSPESTTNWVGFDLGSARSGITTTDMACGKNGANSVNRTCPINAGDSIALLHRAWADGVKPEAGPIDPQHHGSTAIYMKKMAEAGSSDPWSTPAAGDGWFKIFYDGYDTSTGKWGVDNLIANNGLLSSQIPTDLASGYYLIRSEVLALQNVTNDIVQPQFYAGCAQVYVAGTGSAAPTSTVSIPGYVDESTPAMNYNFYQETQKATPFEEFGPPVYGNGGSTTSSRASKRSVAFRNRRRHGRKNRTSQCDSDLDPDASDTPDSPDSPDSPDLPDATDPADATAAYSTTISSTSGIVSTATDQAGYSASMSSILPAATDDTSVDQDSDSASPASGLSSSTETVTSTTTITTPIPVVTDAVDESSNKVANATTSAVSSSSSISTNSSIVGLCPSDTVLEVDNQCLTEIPSWSNDSKDGFPKCWAASASCFDTSKKCWDNRAPVVNGEDKTQGCNLWDAKCQGIVAWCNAQTNFDGPPDAGKVLTPEQELKRRSAEESRKLVAARELSKRMVQRARDLGHSL